MKRVVIESPYAGDVELHKQYARACVRDCINRGEAPIASHLLYTQEGILNDNDSFERTLGILCGHAWIPIADAVVVYLDYGMSVGMSEGIKVAAANDVPIIFRKLWGFGTIKVPEITGK